MDAKEIAVKKSVIASKIIQISDEFDNITETRGIEVNKSLVLNEVDETKKLKIGTEIKFGNTHYKVIGYEKGDYVVETEKEWYEGSKCSTCPFFWQEAGYMRREKPKYRIPMKNVYGCHLSVFKCTHNTFNLKKDCKDEVLLMETKNQLAGV